MIQLVEYSKVFLDKSWDWLHDEEIKKLTLTPYFSKDEQLSFFSSLPQRSDYWIKGIIYDKVPVGVMGIKNITRTDGEYWGYIGDREFWSRGIGSFMLNAAVHKAHELLFKTLYLHVGSFNERAKRLYIKSGFRFVEMENGIEKYLLEL